MPARLILLLCLALAACKPAPDESHFESETKFRIVRESLYNRILVERDGDIVALNFRVGRNARRQTAVDLTQPSRLVIPYTRTLLAAAFVQPQPRRILQIGLGGGGVNRFIRIAYPEAHLQTVELDAEVLAVAKEFMDFRPDAQDEVTIEDGRSFVKKSREKWDWIIVDAFRDGSVPAHLKTKEFYQLLQSHLAPGGVVAFNVHNGTKLFESDKATLRDVFSQVHAFDVAGTGNVIILAFDVPPPDWEDKFLASNRSASAYMKPHLEHALTEYSGAVTPGGAPVLTDDFAPAEFLEGRSTR